MQTTMHRIRPFLRMLAVVTAIAVGVLPTRLLGQPEPVTWHVSPLGDDATGDGSVEFPFATIQHAVDLAGSGDTIQLADDTYTGPGNRDLLVEARSLVIRSAGGDPAACVIDCELDASGQGRGLTFGLADGHRLDLIGLTITAVLNDAIFVEGPADGLYLVDCVIDDAGDAGIEAELCRIYLQGGRIANTSVGLDLCYILSATCEAYGVTFADNGIGAYLIQGDLNTFNGCWFTGNDTGVKGLGGKSVTPDNTRQAWCHFDDCHFIGNDYGAGPDVDGTFHNCEFRENQLAGVNSSIGGSFVFDKCDVRNNPGDGLIVDGHLTLLNSSIRDNGGLGLSAYTGSGIEISDALVTGNGGIGLQLENGYMGSITLTNVTVADNGAGLSVVSDETVTLENTIVAFNAGEGLCVPEWTTYADCDVYANGPDLCADGWAPGDDGNIAADPLFCDRSLGDYTLAENSPCASSDTQTRIGALDVACGPLYRGTIVIDATPDTTLTPWRLDGPDDLVVDGAADTTLVSLPAGTYTQTWLPGDGWAPPSPPSSSAELEAGAILTYAGTYLPHPYLASVADVGNDQGRQVRLTWNRSAHDAPGSEDPILAYGIYRRQDEGRRGGGDDYPRLAGWDYLSGVPARGDAVYQTVAPTLCDSTADGGICWSVFMVSAQTQDPLVYFDSAPDSGYSVDDLHPLTPDDFQVDFGLDRNELSWQPPTDPDIVAYLVYRRPRDETGVPPAYPPAAEIRGMSWTDTLDGVTGPGWDYAYALVAVDDAGNRSGATAWATAGVTGIGGTTTTPAFGLRGNVPNPFNPTTTIAYGLDGTYRVMLEILDLKGGRVRSLLGPVEQGPGLHAAVWNGADDKGKIVAAGVYLVSLRAGARTETRPMIMIK